MLNHWWCVRIVACCGLAGVACGAPRETADFPGVACNGLLGSAANESRTFSAAGGYALGRLTYSGTLTSLVSSTWRTDSRILVTAPGGAQAVLQPFTAGTTYTSLNFSGQLAVGVGEDPAGLWTFRFFEKFDDGGEAAVDATMSISVVYDDAPPPPPAATDLGTLTPAGVVAAAQSLGVDGFRWYKFTLPGSVSAYNTRYLDADSFGSSLPQPSTDSYLLVDDTQMALYSGRGDLLASDDDSCQGYLSQLSFGAGGRAPVGNGEAFDGGAGSLAPGAYYVALGAYRLELSEQYWGVRCTIGTRTGTIVLRLRTNAEASACIADFNHDEVSDFFDYLDFVAAFDAEDRSADVNQDEVVDFFDYLDFAAAFDAGC